MKFRIQFKDPDGVSDGYDAAVNGSFEIDRIKPKERELLRESRMDEVIAATRRWIEFGEYLSVEFDTEAGTATVVEL